MRGGGARYIEEEEVKIVNYIVAKGAKLGKSPFYLKSKSDMGFL